MASANWLHDATTPWRRLRLFLSVLPITFNLCMKGDPQEAARKNAEDAAILNARQTRERNHAAPIAAERAKTVRLTHAGCPFAYWVCRGTLTAFLDCRLEPPPGAPTQFEKDWPCLFSAEAFRAKAEAIIAQRTTEHEDWVRSTKASIAQHCTGPTG